MNARLNARQRSRYQQGDYSVPGFYNLLQCRRVLMLQGPMGSFFNRVAAWLEGQGVAVSKINFNGGDWLFHRKLDAVDYRGSLKDFPDFLRRYLVEKDIDGVLCFGDCRHYHKRAKKAADALGLPFFVFEEGYVRPDYITLECGGVNEQSSVPRSPAFYRALPDVRVPGPQPAYPSFGRGAWSSMLYYGAGRLLRARYPLYQHHKKFSIRYEARAWCRSWLRKHLNRRRDKPVFNALLREHDGLYFAVALQVYNDSQVTTHSDYADVRDFIGVVLAWFAAHAAARHHLVYTPHPWDRGQRDSRRVIARLCLEHGVAGRVHYVHDVHLPTLLRHSRGVVMINSTVGLSTLYHYKPLKLMGRALYDMEGLTYQGELAQFWTAVTRLDRELWRRFRAYLITQTQLNGAFYGRDFHTLLAQDGPGKARLSAPLQFGRAAVLDEDEADDMQAGFAA
jgi:capsular polysaccharide export protein